MVGLAVGLTLADVAEQQQADPELKVVLNRIEAGLSRPVKEEISHLSPTLKVWYPRWDQLELRGGVSVGASPARRSGDLEDHCAQITTGQSLKSPS